MNYRMIWISAVPIRSIGSLHQTTLPIGAALHSPAAPPRRSPHAIASCAGMSHRLQLPYSAFPAQLVCHSGLGASTHGAHRGRARAQLRARAHARPIPAHDCLVHTHAVHVCERPRWGLSAAKRGCSVLSRSSISHVCATGGRRSLSREWRCSYRVAATCVKYAPPAAHAWSTHVPVRGARCAARARRRT